MFVSGECWRKIDGKVLQNWAPMVKLALPALLLVVAESIGFEILTLLAGVNGTAELGAQALLATLCSFIFKVPFSMGIAASTQIANLPGRGSVPLGYRQVSLFNRVFMTLN